MSEAAFWRKIRPMLKGPGIHTSRVESHQTSAGIPDLDICYSGMEFKVELKYGTDIKIPDVRESQILWTTKRVKAGGRVVIAAKLMIDGKPHYMFYHGRYIKELKAAKTTKEWLEVPGIFVPFLDKDTLMDCLMQVLYEYDITS